MFAPSEPCLLSLVGIIMCQNSTTKSTFTSDHKRDHTRDHTWDPGIVKGCIDQWPKTTRTCNRRRFIVSSAWGKSGTPHKQKVDMGEKRVTLLDNWMCYPPYRFVGVEQSSIVPDSCGQTMGVYSGFIQHQKTCYINLTLIASYVSHRSSAY